MKRKAITYSGILLMSGIFTVLITSQKPSYATSNAGCTIQTALYSNHVGQADIGCEELIYNEFTHQWEWILTAVFTSSSADCVPAPNHTCPVGYCAFWLENCRQILADPD